MSSERIHTPADTNTFTVSVTGIDGAGKDTVIQGALELVSKEDDLSVIKLGRPAYMIEAGESRQVYGRVTGSIDTLHGFADQVGNVPLIIGVNALNVVVQSRLLERRTLARSSVDILATSRDMRVDPVVYARYYARSVTEPVPLSSRLNRMQQITGINRDLIVQLQVSPELAVERIEGRIAAEQRSSRGVMRPKWRHVHENVDDLRMLAEEYDDVLDMVSEKTGVDIVRVATDDMSKDEVIGIVASAIRQSRDRKLCIASDNTLSVA